MPPIRWNWQFMCTGSNYSFDFNELWVVLCKQQIMVSPNFVALDFFFYNRIRIGNRYFMLCSQPREDWLLRYEYELSKYESMNMKLTQFKHIAMLLGIFWPNFFLLDQKLSFILCSPFLVHFINTCSSCHV